MDRDEALKLLKGGAQGIAEWNRRCLAGDKTPDLSEADLSGADLRRALLGDGVLKNIDLSGANLGGAYLPGANLMDAHLGSAELDEAILGFAILRGADLSGANLTLANLTGAYLSGANLSRADLSHSNLSDAELPGGSLTDATCLGTIFANVNLSEVKGLESIKHAGPSTIGIDTILRSKGKIPEVFLRGCGMPDALIKYIPSLIGSMEPIQFYSCFISYSTADEEFASRLHNDFQAAGIRCWKWDHDARTGRSLWGEIDQAIRVYDKLVLIASKSSLKSPAVNREIERAIVQEDERLKPREKGKKKIDADVLFPVTLDAYIFTKWKHERKVDVTKKVIADAKGWDADAGIYAKVRDKLIRDLKAEASAGQGPRTTPRSKPR
jgi:TIR domain/Pentapeptide repeats (8 copies)